MQDCTGDHMSQYYSNPVGYHEEIFTVGGKGGELVEASLDGYRPEEHSRDQIKQWDFAVYIPLLQANPL